MKMIIPFGKIFRRSGGEIRRSVERDWLLILTAFVCGLVFISVYAVYFYRRVESGAFYGAATVAQDGEASLNTKRLGHVVTLIEEREKWSEKVLLQLSDIVDPSQ